MRDALDNPVVFILVLTVAVVAMAHALAYVTGKAGLASTSGFFAFKNNG